MTKILMPYYTPKNVSCDRNIETDTVILGGIERFEKHIYDHIEGVVPIHIGKDDNYKMVMEQAIAEHDIDMILMNNMKKGVTTLNLGIPVVFVVHDGLMRGMSMLSLMSSLLRFKERGAHIYFVSEFQKQYFDDFSMRSQGKEIGEIQGYLSPSYCLDSFHSSPTSDYDLSTVGRFAQDKDPFFIHRNTDDNINALVMTNLPKSPNKSDAPYINKFKDTERSVKYGLKHNEIIENLRNSGVFCSTWPYESWGITAMEALGNGIPTILVTDKYDYHASETIAATSLHYTKAKKKCSVDEFTTIVRNVTRRTTPGMREDISGMTKEKNSLKNWKAKMDAMIDRRMSDVPNKLF